MATQLNLNRLSRPAEWILAVVGAANCIVVPFFFVEGQSPLFPFPGLYLIEIALLGVLGLISIIVEQNEDSRWRVVPWAVAGILLAFVVLGAWTIGFFLIPATLAFLLAGVLGDRRLNRPLVNHAGVFLIAAIVQAAVMLTAVLFT